MYEIISNNLNNIGLIANLVGTFMIAFSFGAYPDKKGAPSTTDKNGSEKYIAYFNYPKLFSTGLFLLGFGFALQLEF
ncbi:MAG: hypothetical protein U9P50_01990 [Patescibacteria group bacterium]|nr:hypothetical protein [Patescibacteria group bacterium]